MLCVECGKNKEAINGVCAECFLKGKQIVTLPHHADLERCTNCEEFFAGGKWVAAETRDAVEDCAVAVLAAIPEAKILSVGTVSQELDPMNRLVTMEVDTDVAGTVSASTVSTTVRIKNTVCKRCSRQLGNYYEATLQIRSSGRTLDDAVRDKIVRRVRHDIETAARNNRGLFITKVTEVAGGIDILLSSISMGRTLARDLADSYGGEYKESSKLVGMTEEGNEMHRLTYLVRLPEYNVGDIIRSGGELCRLNWVGKNGGKVTRLRDFREMTVRRSDMDSVRTVLTEKDLKEATVVSRSAGEIQVVHPANYSTVDIRVPADAEIGETVKVAYIDDDLLYVPDR
jgi:nonsense-mediated mRNA decay protein 3